MRARTPFLLMLVILAAFAWPAAVRAQPNMTRLTITGFPLAFPSPTAADFNAGFITSANATTFTVEAQNGTTAQRTTTVAIRCEMPCPATGSKPLNTLRWRRADLGTWNTLTTNDVVIESRPVWRGQPLPASNDPWSNSLFWQFSLNWLADQQNPTEHRYNIVFTLTVTIP